jgi:hypothetical protein
MFCYTRAPCTCREGVSSTAQAVSRLPLTLEAGSCGNCGQSGKGTRVFSPRSSVFPCQLTFTAAPH